MKLTKKMLLILISVGTAAIVAMTSIIIIIIVNKDNGGDDPDDKTTVQLGTPVVTLNTNSKMVNWLSVGNAKSTGGYTIKIGTKEVTVNNNYYSLALEAQTELQISVKTNGYETDTHIYTESAYSTAQLFDNTGKTRVNLDMPVVTLNTVAQTATWTPVTNANSTDGYTIRIGTEETILSETTYSFAGFAQGTYSIRVKANGYETNSHIYNESAYSIEQDYYTDGPPTEATVDQLNFSEFTSLFDLVSFDNWANQSVTAGESEEVTAGIYAQSESYTVGNYGETIEYSYTVSDYDPIPTTVTNKRYTMENIDFSINYYDSASEVKNSSINNDAFYLTAETVFNSFILQNLLDSSAENILGLMEKTTQPDGSFTLYVTPRIDAYRAAQYGTDLVAISNYISQNGIIDGFEANISFDASGALISFDWDGTYVELEDTVYTVYNQVANVEKLEEVQAPEWFNEEDFEVRPDMYVDLAGEYVYGTSSITVGTETTNPTESELAALGFDIDSIEFESDKTGTITAFGDDNPANSAITYKIFGKNTSTTYIILISCDSDRYLLTYDPNAMVRILTLSSNEIGLTMTFVVPVEGPQEIGLSTLQQYVSDCITSFNKYRNPIIGATSGGMNLKALITSYDGLDELLYLDINSLYSFSSSSNQEFFTYDLWDENGPFVRTVYSDGTTAYIHTDDDGSIDKGKATIAGYAGTKLEEFGAHGATTVWSIFDDILYDEIISGSTVNANRTIVKTITGATTFNVVMTTTDGTDKTTVTLAFNSSTNSITSLSVEYKETTGTVVNTTKYTLTPGTSTAAASELSKVSREGQAFHGYESWT